MCGTKLLKWLLSIAVPLIIIGAVIYFVYVH